MLAIVFGIILTFAHYLSDKFHIITHKNRMKILSFSAGISITYIFLYLFPELFQGVQYLSRLIFLFVLIGFIGLHIIEAHIFREKTKSKIQKELKEVHSLSFFIYHLIVGIALFNITSINPIAGLLLFLPILLHTITSSISLREIHAHIKEKAIIKFILEASTLIGILIASFVFIPPYLYNAFIGFVVGALLYVVVRDMMPKGGKGNPLFLVGGSIVYLILLWIILML